MKENIPTFYVGYMESQGKTVILFFLPTIIWGEGHFGAADSELDNSAPCRFGAGHFGAVS